jgi:hypothetical protein
MNFVMAIKAHGQEKLGLVQSIPKPTPAVMHLACHLASTHLAYRVIGKKLFPHILIDFVLTFSLFRDSA